MQSLISLPGVEGLWAGLRARRSAVRTITRFDPSPFRSHIAAEIPDFAPGDHLGARELRRLDRFSQLGVAAARLALSDAGVDPAGEDRDRIGVMMGSALGGVAHAESQATAYQLGGLRAVDANLALTVFGGAVSCNIAIAFGLTGPNATNGMSCASGTVAVGDGLRAIQRGEADVMLCGGAEAPLAPLCFGAFAVIRAMSTRNDDPATASRPFDRDRRFDARGLPLVLRSRSAVARALPWRRGGRLRPHQRRPPHDGAEARRPRGGPRHDPGPSRRPGGSGGGRLRQRPRLVHAAQRLDGDGGIKTVFGDHRLAPAERHEGLLVPVGRASEPTRRFRYSRYPRWLPPTLNDCA
jgi:hypothetical protein